MFAMVRAASQTRDPMKRLAALFALLALPPPPSRRTSPRQGEGRRRPAAAVADFDKDGDPNLQSTAALVLDAKTGQTLFAKNADAVHPIASITKLMTAMVVLDSKLPLDEADPDHHATTSTRSRARGRACRSARHFRRDDLIRIALVASDNRAAAALGRSYPGGIAAFVDAMNAKAQVLGLQRHALRRLERPRAGQRLEPRGTRRAWWREASSYPLIREYSTTPALDVTLPDTGRKVAYVNTNALVRPATGTSACPRPATSASPASAWSCRP